MFIYKQEMINYFLKIASFSIQVTQVPIYFHMSNFKFKKNCILFKLEYSINVSNQSKNKAKY